MPTKTSNSKSSWSAKDIYDMIFSTYGNAHVNANKARAKEASKYMIPYIPEKEIMLTTGRYNTGKISTNLLDSIYNASQRTGIPLDIALGLAGRESTLGIGRGFKKGKSVSGTDLYSNWQQIQTIPNNKAQMKKWNSLLGRTDLTDEDYDFKSGFLIRAQDSLENTKSLDENPIDNALKFYQTGKYNPGDSRHTQMVEDDAKILMSDPAIQKWLKTKTGTQMKCGGRRKAQLGLDIREGGIAIPIANNMWYIHGRKHEYGGVTMGPNNKNGVEVEGGEVVEMIDSNHPSVGRQFAAGGQSQTMRVFSSVPLLRGVSPAQLVMEGANPDTVFKAQEEFKDRNRINDDGTRYEIGGEKTIKYENLPNVFKGKQVNGKILQGGVPPILSQGAGLTRGNFIQRMGMWNDDLGEFSKYIAKRIHKFIPKKLDLPYRYVVDYFSNKGPNNAIDNNAENLTKAISLFNAHEYKAGGIYIKPSKRGTFTAAATKHGMGVQEFASKVLANKEDYSPAMVKKANFARNASRWKKEYGGNMIYTINGNVRNGLSVRPKAKYGTIDKKDKDTKVGPDGLIYKRAADGEWYTDGTVHVAYKPITKSSREDLYYANPVQGLYHDAHDGNFANVSSIVPDEYEIITRKFDKPKRTYVGGYDEEEKETKKIGSLTYEKNESGQWVPSKKQSVTTTRDGGRPKDFGMTRTGVNHPNGNYKYHPLTGEKINEIGVVETSEPSVKGTTKVTSKSSSTPRGRGTKASTPKAATKSTPTIQDTVNKITVDAWKASKTPKINLSKVEMPSYNVSDLGGKETKAAKAKINTSSTGGVKEAPWVPQYNLINTRDWIGVGTNLAGHIASYFANNALLKKAPMPTKPISFQAAKLKTTHNINPDLANINEVTQMNLAEVGRNTASSNTSIARKQRIMNEARDARNKLYGQKENIETQLINLDRRNRQDVYNRNIAAYNDWLDKTYVAKSNNLLNKQRNLTNLISGIPMAVNTMLGTIENRKSTNDMIRAIAAANPNVDGRLFGIGDYYSQKLPDGRTAIYNKNHKLVKYV